MHLRNTTITDEDISINITYPPGHDNSIELPENPAYTTFMIIGLGIIASCVCYCCTAKLVLGENLPLDRVIDHINLIITLGKDTTTTTAE